ncbi:MAG: UDP-N-acetylmuramoyl-L-alanine--D-glutamate ligase [Pseudomonadota bacterium]|nr:UDP-N-acetylmuramoyl-L-alanine--D-glutamate ligase [Pseudomonadota bacterium]
MADNKEPKHIVVVGLGATGFSIAVWAHQQGYRVTVLDDRDRPPYSERLKSTCPSVQLAGQSDCHTLYHQANLIAISPGLSPNHPMMNALVASEKPFMTDIELFQLYCDKPLIGITGSNGKTTVSKMVELILNESGLNAALVGNVGIPIMSLLDHKRYQQYDCFVVELSSFQLYWLKKVDLAIGVVLNLHPNHLDWHENMQHYWQAKKKVLTNTIKPILAKQALSYDEVKNDPSITRISTTIPESDDILYRKVRKLAHGQALENLVSSYVSAWIIGKTWGVDELSMANGLKKFKPWPYRCMKEDAQHVKGTWYNDAKSSNLAAAKYAISHVWLYHQKPIIWIAGGVSKNEDMATIDNWVPMLKQAIFYGKDASLFQRVLQQTVVPTSLVETLEDAIDLIKLTVDDDCVIVFSPAAASFDQFNNFEHRGHAFTEHLGRCYETT